MGNAASPRQTRPNVKSNGHAAYLLDGRNELLLVQDELYMTGIECRTVSNEGLYRIMHFAAQNHHRTPLFTYSLVVFLGIGAHAATLGGIFSTYDGCVEVLYGVFD